MTYILRTHIKKKYLALGLQSVFGIGSGLSKVLCKRLGFSSSLSLPNLTAEQISNLSDLVQELKVPIKGDLRRFLKSKIDFLSHLKTYRGLRHRQGLPCRGQRTHTNARTQKKLRFSRKIL